MPQHAVTKRKTCQRDTGYTDTQIHRYTDTHDPVHLLAHGDTHLVTPCGEQLHRSSQVGTFLACGRGAAVAMCGQHVQRGAPIGVPRRAGSASAVPAAPASYGPQELCLDGERPRGDVRGARRSNTVQYFDEVALWAVGPPPR